MILAPVRGKWRISQRYEQNLLPIYAKHGLASHAGTDYVSDDRTVYSCFEGYCKLKIHEKGYGRHIEITSLPYNKGGEQRFAVYGHLLSFIVKDGQYVPAGEPIGVMGSTGDSTGIHLHLGYKVLKDGVVQNENNGNKGYLDILPYMVGWYPVGAEQIASLGTSRVASGLSAILSRLRFNP